WQLTGLKIYSDPFPPETADRRRLIPEEQPIPPGVIKQVSDIIVTTDLEDRIVYWNNAAEKFYAIPSLLAIGQPFHELFHYDYVDTTAQKVQKLLQERGFWEGETTYVSSDGKKSYLICSIRYVRDSNRHITGIM